MLVTFLMPDTPTSITSLKPTFRTSRYHCILSSSSHPRLMDVMKSVTRFQSTLSIRIDPSRGATRRFPSKPTALGSILTRIWRTRVNDGRDRCFYNVHYRLIRSCIGKGIIRVDFSKEIYLHHFLLLARPWSACIFSREGMSVHRCKEHKGAFENKNIST